MDRVIKDYRKLFFIFLLVAFSCLGVVTQGQAIQPAINDIIITNNKENVLLYARLANAFKTEMESTILAGVPAVFTVHLEVYRVRSVVWDKKITSYEIKRTIKYDNLKKTFSIFTNGNEASVIFSDFESAQKAMADLSGIVIVPLQKLVRGNNYYLRLKVKIDKVRLPLHMEYVFLFVSFWDFETAWYKQMFSY
ncbi:MAG: hypothetical protein CVU52_02235 [Deltaproteobacteria bacterium HGW-Deltaproteobacteria-10]|nr:MAG: hypothetical protein CVU52_02235 [Deltaproteobacteria bacterium HGW-Deltaproteobacteria-10]